MKKAIGKIYWQISGVHNTALWSQIRRPTIPRALGDGGARVCGPVLQVAYSGILDTESVVMDPCCNLQVWEIIGHEGELFCVQFPMGKPVAQIMWAYNPGIEKRLRNVATQVCQANLVAFTLWWRNGASSIRYCTAWMSGKNGDWLVSPSLLVAWQGIWPCPGSMRIPCGQFWMGTHAQSNPTNCGGSWGLHICISSSAGGISTSCGGPWYVT